jgi:hypothetical protein
MNAPCDGLVHNALRPTKLSVRHVSSLLFTLPRFEIFHFFIVHYKV